MTSALTAALGDQAQFLGHLPLRLCNIVEAAATAGEGHQFGVADRLEHGSFCEAGTQDGTTRDCRHLFENLGPLPDTLWLTFQF